MKKPFAMDLEGVADPEMTERDFINLCCSIGDSMDFGIGYPKTIQEIRRFHTPDKDSYTNTFTFHVEFPTKWGTLHGNKKFVAEKMAYLLPVLLEDFLTVGLEDAIDTTKEKTFGILKVPV